MAESSQSSLSFERNLHPFLLEMYKIRIGDPYAPMHDLEAELSKRPDLQRCDAKEFCESWAVAKLTENIAAKPLTPEELTLEAAELLTDACNRRFGHSGESAVAGILKLISERCVAEARARRPAAIVDRVGSSFKTILAIGTALIFAGAFWESVKGDVAAAVTQASSTFHGLGRQFAPLTWWDGAILVAVVLFGTVLGDAVLETGASARYADGGSIDDSHVWKAYGTRNVVRQATKQEVHDHYHGAGSFWRQGEQATASSRRVLSGILFLAPFAYLEAFGVREKLDWATLATFAIGVLILMIGARWISRCF